MYIQIANKFRSSAPDFPSEPNLDLGLGIKQIRLRMGMTQSELAADAGMKPAALKTLENGYAKFTTVNNLESLSQALRTPLRDILLEAREWFPSNFFVTKLSEISSDNRKRRRKHREDIWFKQKPMIISGSQITPISPPFSATSHFSFWLISIGAGKELRDLTLPYPNQITGFVERGSLRVIYNNSQERTLFGNQGFSFRGDKTHHFINQDKDNPLLLCIAFSLIPEECIRSAEPHKAPASFSIGRAIKQIRNLYSHSSKNPLSFSELSRLTGMDGKALKYLEQTTHRDQVIYWDKIERITQSLKIPFSRFLELAEGHDAGYFYHATAHDRALIDYRHFLGVRIKSALFPGSHNRFHIAEMYIDPKGGIRRASWQRKDDAKICVFVEDGELLVEVGKNRKTSLRSGESVYFDGSLGYIFTNTGNKPAKLLFSSYPPIIF